MKPILNRLALALLLTVALGACSETSADQSSAAAKLEPSAVDAKLQVSAAAAKPTREPALLESKLEGLKTTDGKDLDSVMYIADFPPGSASSHHAHPGWEYNYILEGSVTFEVPGQKPFTRKAGEAMYNPRGNSHTVRNASQTQPARLVSVLVKEEGAPVAVDVP